MNFFSIYNRFQNFNELHGSCFYFLKRYFYNFVKIPNNPIIYVYASRRNVGDYLSYKGIRKIFNLQGLECFASPAALSELRFFIKIAKRIHKNPILIIGGGGLLQEIFDPFWKYILDEHISFLIFGIGINKLANYRKPTKDSLLKSIVNNALFMQVRDNMTREHIKELTDISVPIGICPSVNYIYPSYWRSHFENNNILLHVIHPFDLQASAGSSKFLETLRLYLQEVADFHGLLYREEINISLKAENVLKKFYEARLVVSSRLHGCIISYAMGIPFMPLACDDKISSFLDTFVPDVVPVKTNDLLNFNFIKTVIGDFLKRQINYQNKLKNYVQANVRQANSLKKLLQFN